MIGFVALTIKLNIIIRRQLSDAAGQWNSGMSYRGSLKKI